MQKTFPKQTNFSSGEIDEALDARTDIQRRANAVKAMFNWTPLQQGGTRRASGTRYVATLDGVTRLVQFEISPDDWWIIALADHTMSIYGSDTLAQVISTPWDFEQIWAVDFTQLRDQMVLAQEDHPPYLLWRSVAGFVLEDLTDAGSSQYLTNVPIADDAMRWAATYYMPPGTVIIPTTARENGYYYTVKSASGTQQSGTTEPTWPKTVGATVTNGGCTFECSGPVTAVQVWSPLVGYPRTVTFSENRLCFGGSKSYPTKRWWSRTGEYFNFDPGLGFDSEAISDERLSDQLETVQWGVYNVRYVSGTTAQEWVEQGVAQMTPGNCDIRPHSSVGSERVTPVVVDDLIFHVARGGQQIAGLLWNELAQKYESSSFSLLNTRALTNVRQLGRVRPTDPKQAPQLWCINKTGDAGVFSTQRTQDFVAWCRRGVQGSIESAASAAGKVYLAAAFGHGDGVFAPGTFAPGTFRDQNATRVRFLVVVDETVFTDATVKLSSPVETTIWSVPHLAGWLVDAIIDGVIERGLEVAGDGTLTTATAGLQCHVGVPLPTPTMELLPPAIETTVGSADMRLKRIVRAEVQTTGGAVRTQRAKGWKRFPTTVITADDPVDVTVLAVTQEVLY